MTAARWLEAALWYALLLSAGLALAGWLVTVPWPARAQDCQPGAFGCGHHQGHDIYKGWKSGKGVSCCSGQDCRPIRAKQDVNGGWHIYIPEFRQWWPVPASAMLPPDKFGDGRSHACTSDPLGPVVPLAVFCFTPGQVRG